MKKLATVLFCLVLLVFLISGCNQQHNTIGSLDQGLGVINPSSAPAQATKALQMDSKVVNAVMAVLGEKEMMDLLQRMNPEDVEGITKKINEHFIQYPTTDPDVIRKYVIELYTTSGS